MKRSPTRDEARTSRHALRQRSVLAVVGAAAIAALFASSDRGRGPHDSLEECVEYAATVRRCFGERAHADAPPAPATEEERAKARRRCVADKERIERACR